MKFFGLFFVHFLSRHLLAYIYDVLPGISKDDGRLKKKIKVTPLIVGLICFTMKWWLTPLLRHVRNKVMMM